ncbi:MAG: TraB/GumN family protein, partial [Flavobacteriales bacterium]
MRKDHRKALLAVSMCALFAPLATAQQAQKYDALLWKISGGGLAKPSYLYGTMHVSSKVAFHLSEEFFAALEQSDLVALEMDPATWLGELGSKWFTALASAGAEGKGSSDLYHDAFELSFPDRKVITAALAQDPEVVNQLLYRMTAGNMKNEEDTYLDLFIYQCGQRSGKPVLGLEGMEHAMLQLVKAITPDGKDPDPARQKRMREAYAKGIDPNQAIEDSYRAQDLDRMDTLFDLTSVNDRMRKYVIDERNTVFLEAMLPQLGERSVFTGVGAMHLPGPKGLIELLRAKGYTVEPVHGAVSSRSRASQHKHEVAYRPVEWRMQWPADSAFSIELPAPLHEISFRQSSTRVLLSADMVNGSHFIVQRIPTFAAIRGLTSEQVLAQVDSALYEGVPGRIEKVTRFTTNNGWPGMDVRSLDRTGRVVHHKVVVSPFEIFVFERTMRDLAQAAKDGDRVFASIRFADAPVASSGTWGPSYGGYQVEMPARRQAHEEEPRIGWLTESRVEKILTVQATNTDGSEGMLAMSAFYPDVTTIEQDTFELAVLAEQFGASFGLSDVHKGEPVARSIRAQGTTTNGDTIRYMVALSGDRYDLLCARATATSAARFFDSYRTVPYRATEPIEQFKDTLMHFSVRTASTQQQLMDHLSSFGEYFQQVWGDQRREANNMHEQELRAMLYRSATTPEGVLVDFERFHRFATEENETEFWDERVNALADDGRITVKDRRMTGEREARRVEFLLVDSASSRTVRVLMQQCPGALYTLRAVAFADGQLSAWADSFIVSFRPDTVFSDGIFTKKGGTLLQWISGTDSTRVEQAEDSFRQVSFEDADAPALMDYVRSAEARDKDHGRRLVALEKLGALHHPKVIPFLREVYAASGDTAELRFAVLEALAYQLTREGSNAFMDLMTADPPLTEDDWRVDNAFGPFYDSLQVAKILFPRAWSLMSFPEFEGSVLNLAAALVDKHLMLPAEYAARKPDLLFKARSELKRAIASAKQGTPEYEYDDEEEAPTASGRNYAWRTNLTLMDEKEALEYHEVPPVNTWTQRFEAYHRLLLPFIKEAEVKAYFDQALSCGADAVELTTATFLQKNGAAVPAGFWQRYAVRDDARLWTYRTLKVLGHPEFFDASLLTPQQNATAYFFSGYTTFKEDSVHLVGIRDGATRFGSGPVYFFVSKIKQEDKPDEWMLSGTGFFAEGDTDPFTGRFIYSAEDNITDLDEAPD